MVFTCYSLTCRLIGKKDPVAPQDEKKYIVFFSCLMKLFAVCPNCTEPGTAEVTEVIGTQIYVTQKCPTCKFVCQWKSQPNIRRILAGNLLLSAAILYLGSMISQTLRIFKILKVECFSWQTFHKHQNNYLIPFVTKLWKEEQDRVIQNMSALPGGVVLLGDGRSDSPGHCAKYGAFTIIEQRVNKVLDVQLVQVRTWHFNNSSLLPFFSVSWKVLLSVPTSLMRCGSLLGVNTGVFLIWNDFWLPKGFYSMSSLLKEIVKMPLTFATKWSQKELRITMTSGI